MNGVVAIVGAAHAGRRVCWLEQGGARARECPIKARKTMPVPGMWALQSLSSVLTDYTPVRSVIEEH